MKVFKDNHESLSVRGLAERLTEGSSEDLFREALAIEPKIGDQYLTPEFLAKLRADAPTPKQAGSTAKTPGKDS